MKRHIGFLLLLILSNSFCLQAQKFGPQMQKTDFLKSKPEFSLNEYLKECKESNDTTWMPQRQDIYLWNGKQLEQQPVYHLLYYNNPAELSKLITMDTQTNDSLLRLDYEYDEASQNIQQIFFIYDSVNLIWKIDYKALYSYDQFGNVDTTLIQAWNIPTQTWHDSIASISVYLDAHFTTKYTVERISEGIWTQIYGVDWIYSYNDLNQIYRQVNHRLNFATQEWAPEVSADFYLNDDGAPYEMIWYSWDAETETWLNGTKYTDIVWKKYVHYPDYYKTLTTSRTFHWWKEDHWYTYLKDEMQYHSEDYEDRNYQAYSWDNLTQKWYQSADYQSRHYDTTRLKRRYTDYVKYNINEDWQLHFDDSCRWYFYKGALQEMQRVCYDTTLQAWRPAARLLYSDFIPFVDISDVEELHNQSGALKLIPNPVDDSFEIKNNNQITEITIFDINGKLILREKDLLFKPSIKIDVSALLKGTYIVRAKTNTNQLLSTKLIVN